MDITKKTECVDDFSTLDFDSHHSIPIPDSSKPKSKMFKPCDVASWGAYLVKRNVLAISFAPRDNHEAQVQFDLERGVPAIVGNNNLDLDLVLVLRSGTYSSIAFFSKT
ncbi:hypothetical protein L1987_14811 [Smallanthus sonchifolius]|uniref:Uncharacterized protein n=1 Tax=Smallanthus sonchifolius TaxID=185202 RepID=A0ACB9J5V6_9ASTR|nr:hypothetical protein L1987_14811 [Smallanthus sonchifolius]